jgi:hypothetical protein
MIKPFLFLIFIIMACILSNSNYDLSSILFILYIGLVFLITFPFSIIIMYCYISLYFANNDL